MRIRPILGALPLVVLVGCIGNTGAPDSEELQVSEDGLVGGQVALESQVRATVWLKQVGCTGAKVGPRHFLLAAHCVEDTATGDVKVSVLPGQPFPITTNNTDITANVFNLTVEKTSIFPLWTSTSWSRGTYVENGVTYPKPNVLNSYHPPDLALVVVKETTPDIPSASIDSSPVLPGDQVMISGYGCEYGLILDKAAPQPPNSRRLLINTQAALPSSALQHVGSWVTSSTDATAVAASYVITPGRASSSSAASSCPGDSGGPLYRAGTSDQRVVGVNAYYTFPSYPSDISTTNLHTRLDSAAATDVLAWLTSLGVRTTGLKAQYKNLELAPVDNHIKPGIQLVNNTTAPVNLSSVKVRYWFTRNVGASTYTTSCDYVGFGCANLTQSVEPLTTPRAGADTYLEVGFTAGAGTLPVGGTTGVAQLRLNKTDWSTFNESDDYSYSTNTGAPVDFTKITVYVNGRLVWGAEP